MASFLSENGSWVYDKREEIGNASSFKKARKIINTYISKDGVNFDPKNGKTTFYVTEEA